MSAPAKFLFDVDFEPPREAGRAGASPRRALEVALAEAEARGYRNGYAAAQAEASAEAERRTAAAAGADRHRARCAGRQPRAVERRLEAEAVEVAVAVASKLAPELIAREPFAEIAALAADCFDQLVGAPHVVVRVNDALYADARERLEEIAAHARLRGPAGGARPSPTSRSATAASNGPTAASIATAPRSKRRSTRRSPATSRCAAIPRP